MSNAILLELIRRHVTDVLDANANKPLDGNLKAAVLGAIDAASAELAAALAAAGDVPTPDTFSYETALGAYILQQNPYASREKIVLPQIPSDPLAERPWIRKAGVLRNYHALKPLPREEAIPSGPIYEFAYENWPYLAETYVDPNDANNPENHTDFYTEREPGKKPAIPAKDSRHYPHNIVKTVRLRYTLVARRYDDGKGPKGEENDRQAAYILIQYTGSDSG